MTQLILTKSIFEKMSAGQITHFINDPADWILNTYFDPPPFEQRNPWMWRGKIIEATIEKALIAKYRRDPIDVPHLLLEAKSAWNKYFADNKEFLALRADLQKEYHTQWFFIKSSITKNLLNILDECGNLVKSQQGLRKNYPGYSFRVTGVADFVFSAYIIELKSKTNVDWIDPDHVRQVCIYSDIMNLKPRLLQWGDTSYKIIKISEDEQTSAMNDVFNALNAIEYIRSNPTVETFRMYVPKSNNWSDRHKEIGRQIWRL